MASATCYPTLPRGSPLRATKASQLSLSAETGHGGFALSSLVRIPPNKLLGSSGVSLRQRTWSACSQVTPSFAYQAAHESGYTLGRRAKLAGGRPVSDSEPTSTSAGRTWWRAPHLGGTGAYRPPGLTAGLPAWPVGGPRSPLSPVPSRDVRRTENASHASSDTVAWSNPVPRDLPTANHHIRATILKGPGPRTIKTAVRSVRAALRSGVVSLFRLRNKPVCATS